MLALSWKAAGAGSNLADVDPSQIPHMGLRLTDESADIAPFREVAKHRPVNRFQLVGGSMLLTEDGQSLGPDFDNPETFNVEMESSVTGPGILWNVCLQVLPERSKT